VRRSHLAALRRVAPLIDEQLANESAKLGIDRRPAIGRDGQSERITGRDDVGAPRCL
jgi:hypothetical protein